LADVRSTPSDRRYISISSSGPAKSFSTASTASSRSRMVSLAHVLSPESIPPYLLNKLRLGSGLGITASSWAQFWRQKNLINGGIAAWNTYAQISNIVSAVRFVPEAIGNVFSAFKGDDEEDNRALLVMLAVVLVAVGAGVMTARAIILATARKSAQTVLSELQTQHVAT
jgi:hypothetical protein